jgi:hypothetical protein
VCSKSRPVYSRNDTSVAYLERLMKYIYIYITIRHSWPKMYFDCSFRSQHNTFSSQVTIICFQPCTKHRCRLYASFGTCCSFSYPAFASSSIHRPCFSQQTYFHHNPLVVQKTSTQVECDGQFYITSLVARHPPTLQGAQPTRFARPNEYYHVWEKDRRRYRRKLLALR